MGAAVGVLPLTVALHPSLLSSGGAPAAIADRVEEEVGQLLGELGLVAAPTVYVESNEESDRVLSLRIGDHVCHFPDEPLLLAIAYVDGSEVTPGSSAEALEALQTTPSDDHGIDRTADVIAQVCRAVLSARPERMFVTPGSALDHAGEPSRPIELLIEPSYLSLLMSIERDTMFPFMREGLFVELGLELPRFHFVPDRSLRRGTFAFRIDGLRMLPQVGLTNRILVNDTAERLVMYGIEAKPTLNPSTWKPAAIVEDDHLDQLEELGFTTWDAWQYLILSFAATLRARAYRLMTRELAEAIVARMASMFPTVERAVRMTLTIDEVTLVLRQLLLEGVSIRNLRRILELLLRRATSDAISNDVDAVAFVRSHMADAIAYKFARGTGTVVAYLLDPAIERALIPSAPAPELADQIVGAVENEMETLPRTAQTPVILTQPEIRARASALLRDRFPHIVVLAYGELPPNYNVQPIARIALPAQS